MITSRKRQNDVSLCMPNVDVKNRMVVVESGVFFQNQIETSEALKLRILTSSKDNTKRGVQEKVSIMGVRCE